MQPGQPPNAPKSHYRNISGFRNIKGKPHFFAHVERRSSQEESKVTPVPPLKLPINSDGSVIGEVYDQTIGQPIIVKNSSRCVIL